MVHPSPSPRTGCFVASRAVFRHRRPRDRLRLVRDKRYDFFYERQGTRPSLFLPSRSRPLARPSALFLARKRRWKMSPGIKKVVTLGEVGATDGRHHVPLHAREGLVALVTVLVNPRDLEGTFLRELALRIEGLLRDRPATLARAQRRATTTVCELLIDQDAHRVTVSGEEISLTALEFKLLVALTGRLDRVYPRRA